MFTTMSPQVLLTLFLFQIPYCLTLAMLFPQQVQDNAQQGNIRAPISQAILLSLAHHVRPRVMMTSFVK